MGGKSKSYVSGYQLFWGLHVIPCASEIDGVVAFHVDDRECWFGPPISQGRMKVEALTIFGGNDREGGIGGYVDCISGEGDTVNEYLKQVLENGVYDLALTPTFSSASHNPAQVSAYRGVFSMVFRQFYWGNVPRQKSWSVKLRNIFHTQPEIIEGQKFQWLPEHAPILPDYRIEDMLIHVAADFSGSMTSPPEKEVQMRLALKNMISVLAAHEAQYGSTFALRIQPWDEVSRTAYEAIPFTAADETAALNYIDSIAAAGGQTLYDKGTDSAPQFYADAEAALLGSAQYQNFTPAATGGANAAIQDYGIGSSLKRVMIFASDGIATTTSSVDQAAATIQSIAGLEVHAIGIDSVGDLARLDNTGGVVVARNPFDAFTSFLTGPFMHNVDLNAAHIQRHIIIGTNAGGDGDDTKIGASFATAAALFATEDMGFSFYWDKDNLTRDEFRKIVDRHCNSRTYLSATTKQWEIKPIRPDYVKANLPHITKDMIEDWESHHLPRQNELPNQITVVGTDRATGNPMPVTLTNSAALLSLPQPRIKNRTVEYQGITHPTVAEKICQRELRAMTQPFRSGAFRMAYLPADMNEGDAFRLTDDRFDINDEVARVEEVEDHDDGSSSVTIRFTQDVWDDDPATQTLIGQSDTATTGQQNFTPQASTVYFAEEMGYYDLVFSQGQSKVDTDIAADPEYGNWQLSGNRPTPAHSGADISKLQSGSTYQYAAFTDLMPIWTLDADLSSSANDTIFSANLTGREAEIVQGSMIQINSERMRVDSVAINTGAGKAVFTVGRGVLDTVPASHTAGDTIMAWDNFVGSDSVNHTLGETITLRLLPKTPQGALNINSAPDQIITMNERAIRPYPVGDLKVEASYAPPTELSGTVTVTWAHRNRLTQTSQNIQDHTDANITPEASVAGTLIRRLHDAAMTVIHSDTTSIASFDSVQTVNTDLDDLLPYATPETMFASIGIQVDRGEYTNWQTPYVTFLYSPYGTPAAGELALDPYWENVVIMYRFAEINGSTTMPPNEGYAPGLALVQRDVTDTVVHQNLPVINYSTIADFRSTAKGLSQSQNLTDPIHMFGMKDAYGSMTIEWWTYLDALPISGEVHTVWSTSNNESQPDGAILQINPDGSFRFQIGTFPNGVGVLDWTSTPGVMPTNEPVHVALVRSGSRDWEIFVDGLSIGQMSQTAEAIETAEPTAIPMYFAGHSGNSPFVSQPFDGYLDSFRWTIGVPRYIASFTPVEFWSPNALPTPTPEPSATSDVSAVGFAKVRRAATFTTSATAISFDTADEEGTPSVWDSGTNPTRVTAPTGATIAVVTARLALDGIYQGPGVYDEVQVLKNGSVVAKNRWDRDVQRGKNGVSLVIGCTSGDYFEMIADAAGSYNVLEGQTFFSVVFY